MEYHEVADMFPMMTADEFNKLKASIKANGQREPIWTHEGQIVDGRHRHKACVELGIGPHFDEWDEDGSLVQFVLDMNLHRRHLSTSQRGAIAAALEAKYAAEGLERKSEAGTKGKRGKSDQNKDPANLPEVKNRDNESRAKAAKAMNVSSWLVSDAKKLGKDSPELLEEVKQGKISINKAKAKEKTKAQRRIRRHTGCKCGEFQNQLGRLDSAMNRWSRLLAESLWLNDDEKTSVKQHFEAITAVSKRLWPYGPCRDCNGLGEVGRNRKCCSACRGTGYVLDKPVADNAGPAPQHDDADTTLQPA